MIRIKIQSFKIILSDILNQNNSNEKIVPEFYGFKNLITDKINDIKDEIDYSKSLLELYESSKNSLDDGIMFLDFDMNILNFNNKLISLLDSSELSFSKDNKVTDITKNTIYFRFDLDQSIGRPPPRRARRPPPIPLPLDWGYLGGRAGPYMPS